MEEKIIFLFYIISISDTRIFALFSSIRISQIILTGLPLHIQEIFFDSFFNLFFTLEIESAFNLLNVQNF